MSELKHITKEEQPSAAGVVLDNMREKKQKAVRSFINNKGFFVGLILVFIVIVVFTTNVNLTSSVELVKLGLTIFVLIFCSYSMYINCADSGMRAGRLNTLYNKQKNKYDGLKDRIVENKQQIRLAEFCSYYKDEELRNSRKDILDEVGLDYNDYMKKYVGLDNDTIKSNTELSLAQINAIIRANSIKPVKLAPEMIMKCGRGNKRRNPLGVRPETKRGWNYGIKLVTTIIVSIFTGMIALDLIKNPTWATFAELCLKLLTVVLSGFTGYKMGYENITIDTVNYITDQIDLLTQFEQYIENNPAPIVSEKKPDVAVVEVHNEEVVEQVSQPTESVI